jgi:hypothetical protein
VGTWKLQPQARRSSRELSPVTAPFRQSASFFNPGQILDGQYQFTHTLTLINNSIIIISPHYCTSLSVGTYHIAGLDSMDHLCPRVCFPEAACLVCLSQPVQASRPTTAIQTRPTTAMQTSRPPHSPARPTTAVRIGSSSTFDWDTAYHTKPLPPPPSPPPTSSPRRSRQRSASPKKPGLIDTVTIFITQKTRNRRSGNEDFARFGIPQQTGFASRPQPMRTRSNTVVM